MAYRCPVTDMVVNDDEAVKAPNAEMQELSDRHRYRDEQAKLRTQKDGGQYVYPCNHPALLEAHSKQQQTEVLSVEAPKAV